MNTFCFAFLLLITSVGNTTTQSIIDKSASLNSENKPDSAYIFANRALQLAIEEGNRKSEAAAIYQVGKSFMLKNDFTNAMKSFLSADSIYRIIVDSSGIAQTNLQLGLIEYTQQNYSDAIPYFDTAMKIADKSGNKKLSSTCQYLKGIIYIEQDKLDEAEKLLNSALIIKKETGNTQGYYECLSGLAELNFKQGNNENAIKLYRECLNYFLVNENPSGIVIAHIGLGTIFNKLNQTDSALFHYQISYNLSRSINYRRGILKSSKPLAEIYKNKKEFDKAYNLLSQYYSTHDTTYNIENTRKLTKLQNQLSLAQQEIKISQLSKQKENYQIWFLFLVSTTLFLIIVTIIIFRNYRFKQKSNKELETTLKDLRNAQEQLIRSAKLASLGQLTAGVAHELKNPLNFIINFSDDATEILSEFSESTNDEKNQILQNLKMNLEKIQAHGVRANSIITNMMMHARHSDEVKSPTDLSLLLRETIDLAYQGMRAAHPAFYCKMNTEIPGHKIIVNVIVQEMGRIILNMLNNAFYATMQKKAMDDNYTPEIKIRLLVVGRNAEITIEDNGTGMDEKVRARIFEPFFTTKPAGEGTGLGLSMSYDMIRSNGGTITVESEPGTFTRFAITLPL